MGLRKKTGVLLTAGLILMLAASGCGQPAESAPNSSSPLSSVSASSPAPSHTPSPLPSPTPEPAAESSESPESLSEEKKTLRSVAVGDEGAPVYASPEQKEPLRTLPAGEVLEVIDQGNSLWFLMELDNGETACLYGEDLYPLQEDRTPSTERLTQTVIKEKLSALREQFPEGKYWNHMGQDIPFDQETPFSVTDIPCEHTMYGELYCNRYNGKKLELFPEYAYLDQCLGFASFLSDHVFGKDASFYVFYDLDQLQVGDEIRLHEYEHSMFITDMKDGLVTVAEVNENYEDCQISWSRQIDLEELRELSWDSEYISRRPYSRDENGNRILRPTTS